MRTLASVGLLVLFLFSNACCFGGASSSSARVAHRLDPYGVSIDLAPGETGGPAGAGYLFTSGDASSTIAITSAGPGGPAATRSVHDVLLGASTQVEWTRPCAFGDLMGTETRVIESFPHARVHWIGAIDAPSGVLFVDLATDQRWITTPTMGDLAWTTLRDSVRRAP